MSDYSEATEILVQQKSAESQHVERSEATTATTIEEPVLATEKKKDPFVEDLLEVTSIMGEFAAYKEKFASFIDRKDEEMQAEYRPIMRQLFGVGNSIYKEPVDFPFLKDFSSTEDSLQKKIMDVYFKSFNTKDFEFVTAAFKDGPKDDVFAGKAIKQGMTYMQFLNHKMKLGELFTSLCRYAPEKLEAGKLSRIDRCTKQLEKELVSLPINKNGSIEDYVDSLNIRIERFIHFAEDCDSIYFSDRETDTEKRINSEELREKSRKYDSTVRDVYNSYVSELSELVTDNEDAADIAALFKQKDILESGIYDLVRENRNSAERYEGAYASVKSCLLDDLGANSDVIKKQVSEYINRLDTMMAELKARVKEDEEYNLAALRESIEEIKEGQYGSKEDLDDTMEDMVEAYHEMYANRNVLTKVENACASVLRNIFTVLTGGYSHMNDMGGKPDVITDLVNIMPITLSKREKKERIGDILKSCLVMTELMETRFTNPSFKEMGEGIYLNVEKTPLSEAVDPNKHFDFVLEYYAPSVEGEETKTEIDYIRKECSPCITGAKIQLSKLVEGEFTPEATKSVCKLLLGNIKEIDTGFERTNNYYRNVLEQTTEPGSKDATLIARKGLETMLTEIRDYAKFADFMMAQVSMFERKAHQLARDDDKMKQFNDYLSAVSIAMASQIVYSPNKEEKFFETPELVRGKMQELGGVLQLINKKADEILDGKRPFAELADAQSDALEMRKLEDEIRSTNVGPSVMRRFRSLKEQLEEIERQEKGGKTKEYTAKKAELKEQYDYLASVVTQMGESHRRAVEKKLTFERRMYLKRTIEQPKNYGKEDEERVLELAGKVEFNRKANAYHDTIITSGLDRLLSRRTKAMTEHKKKEAKALILEEKRRKELERMEESIRRHDERMEHLEQQKEALLERARQIRESVALRFTRVEDGGEDIDPATLAAEERLEVYIPQNATGRLKDYNLRGRKITGVGKLESIGSCAASKLKDRIGKHTRRFLYSREITSEGLNATAASILKSSGYSDKKYMGAETSAVKNLKLVDRINATTNCTELSQIIAENCQNYIPGDGDGEIRLSERFVNANFAQAKIILMHRILTQTVLTEGQIAHIKESERAAFVDRVDAAKANIALLYRHIVGTREYNEERALAVEDEITGIDSEIQDISREGIDLTQHMENLRDAEQAALETMYTTVDTVRMLDEEALLRARTIAEATHDEYSRKLRYKKLTREVDRLVADADKDKVLRIKKELLSHGRRTNGKYVEGWILDSYSDQVLAYMNKHLSTQNSDIIELALIGFNENLRRNLECIREYLSTRMMGGGDYAYLKNPALYQIAMTSIINACDDNIFTEASKEGMAIIIEKMKPKKLFSEYSSAVSKMLGTLKRDEILEPYAEAIMLDEDYLSAFSVNDKTAVKKVVEGYRKNVQASEEIIASAIADFSYEERLILEANIKSRLGREIIKATPQSVENIIAREIDYRKLLNPVAVTEATKTIEKAKKIVNDPSDEINEAILTAIEEARDLSRRADESDHYETDKDYAQYSVIHAVGLVVLTTPPQELYQYCLEKLAYYVAADKKTASYKSMVTRFLRDYAISHNLEYTMEDVKKANSGMSAAERILTKELFAEGRVRKTTSGKTILDGTREVLQSEIISAETVNMVKGLTPILYERGILSSNSFESLSASDVYELASYAQQRLIPIGAVASQQPSWGYNKEVLKALIGRCLDANKPDAELQELLLIGTNEYAKITSKEEIIRKKTQILAIGNSWRPKKIYVDIVNRRLNTAAGEKAFRDLNRIGRARTLQQKMTEFCEEYGCLAPMSIFEFGALDGNTKLNEEELFTKWKAEIIFGEHGWIEGEKNPEVKKAKRAFYDDSMHEKVRLKNLRLYAYYGLFDDFSVVLKGVGNVINDNSREDFEKKLFEVGRKYELRKKYFLSVCQECHLTKEETDRLQANISERFADAPEVLKSYGEEECERLFREYVDKTVALSSRFVRGRALEEKSGYALEEHERLMAVAVRKDERIGDLVRVKGGIFEPLLPYLFDNIDFQDIILTASEADFNQYKLELIRKASEPMELLSKEGYVYNAFLDQFLIRFKAEIIGDKLNPSESWEDTFRKYYAEIAGHNYGTKDKPVSIEKTIREASEKAAKSSGRSKDTALDNANLVIQVLLSEGAIGIFDKDILQKYSENLKINTAELDKKLEEFIKNDEYKQYIEIGKRHQLMGYTFEDKPEKELKKLFAKSVRLAERVNLVKESPSEYSIHLYARLSKMLTAAVASLDASVTITRLAKQSHELMDTSVLKVKREGRLMMRKERQSLNVYEDRASERISPVMASYMDKKDEMSEKTAHKVEAFQKDMMEKLEGVGYPKALAIEIGSAYVANGKSLSLEEMQICMDNLSRLLAGFKLKSDSQTQVSLIRLAKQAKNPFQVWTEEELTLIMKSSDATQKVGNTYTKILEVKSILPKDGCLTPYYQSVRNAATYIASDGSDMEAEAKLEAMYTLLAKRVLMINVISEFVEANANALIAVREEALFTGQKMALRVGLFDYFAPEICRVDVKYDEKSLRTRMSKILTECINNKQLREYLIDDNGHNASIDSEQSIAEKGDIELESAASKTKFESKLSKFTEDKEAGEAVRKYFMLAPEERSLFAHMAASQAIKDISDTSMSFIMAYGSETEQEKTSVDIGNEYVNSRMITTPVHYLRVEKIIFHGKRPDVSRINLVLSGVESKHREMLEKHVDIKRLSDSSAESRAVLGKAEVKSVDSIRTFKNEISSISVNDSEENKALIDRLVNLRPYELQMMGMILSDRTAVDKRIDSNKPVNVERYELLKRGLRENVARTLADEKAGGVLMNKALASLCSYRVREDVLIFGALTKEDLLDVDRETTIDYDLLKRAFAIMDENHPESLIHEALKYSYDEVKSRAAIEGMGSSEERIRTYTMALTVIKSPDILKNYIHSELEKDLAKEIEQLSAEEWKLFMLLLANRGAVDMSQRLEGKALDEDLKEKITAEYLAHGNVSIDDNVFEDALAGIFSKRIDDAAIAANMDSSVKDAIDKTERRTKLDEKLISDALGMVKNLSEMYRVTEANRRESIL